MLAMVSAPACARGGSNNVPYVNRSGTITIWNSWQGPYLDAKKAIFDSYTKQYPNVTINLVHKDDVATALTTAAAGEGPDIVAGHAETVGKLLTANAIKPIDGVDGVDTNFVNATFSQPAADVFTYNGHVYGLPDTVETVTMIYNKDLVTADQVPKTTDALLAFAKTYQHAHPGSYGVVWNARRDVYQNASWVYGFGGYYVKSDGSVGLTSDGAKAAFAYIASFRPYIPATISNDVANALFKTKKAAVIINGPGALADYTASGINYSFAVLPTTPGGKPAQPFVDVNGLMVASTAPNTALAVDVMKWFADKDNQTAQSVADKEIPANKEASGDPSTLAIPEVKGFGAQLANGTALPNPRYLSALLDPVANALEAVWTGKQSVSDALAAAQQAAQNNVAQVK